MIIPISCEPILEPILGMLISVILCSFFVFRFLKRIKSSEFYKKDFQNFTNQKKTATIIIFLITFLSCLWLIFFIMTMIITGLIFTVGKWKYKTKRH